MWESGEGNPIGNFTWTTSYREITSHHKMWITSQEHGHTQTMRNTRNRDEWRRTSHNAINPRIDEDRRHTQDKTCRRRRILFTITDSSNNKTPLRPNISAAVNSAQSTPLRYGKWPMRCFDGGKATAITAGRP